MVASATFPAPSVARTVIVIGVMADGACANGPSVAERVAPPVIGFEPLPAVEDQSINTDARPLGSLTAALTVAVSGLHVPSDSKNDVGLTLSPLIDGGLPSSAMLGGAAPVVEAGGAVPPVVGAAPSGPRVVEGDELRRSSLTFTWRSLPGPAVIAAPMPPLAKMATTAAAVPATRRRGGMYNGGGKPS